MTEGSAALATGNEGSIIIRYNFKRRGLTAAGLDEGATEGNNLVVRVESNVGNSIGNGDSVNLLLDVSVANAVDSTGGTDMDIVPLYTKLLGDVSDSSILNGSVSTLRQGVLDTSTESLDKYLS